MSSWLRETRIGIMHIVGDRERNWTVIANAYEHGTKKKKNKKAFDTIKHEHLINQLQALDINGKYMRVIKNLYWEQLIPGKVVWGRNHSLGPHKEVRRAKAPLFPWSYTPI